MGFRVQGLGTPYWSWLDMPVLQHGLPSRDLAPKTDTLPKEPIHDTIGH